MGVGVDAERHTDENAPDARTCRKPCLVRSVEHDRRPGGGRGVEERVVLVVAVDHERLAVEPRPQRERQLSPRRDVGANALLAEEPEKRDVGQRLRPEEQPPVVADRRTERPRARPKRRLAEDDERGAVLLGERLGGDPAEAERGPFEGGGVGEQAWHPPIVPVSMEAVQQLLT